MRLQNEEICVDLTFTVDPKDAKDFDDALSFKVLEEGIYEVGIHMADVSYYVKPDTILDEEAFEEQLLFI